VFGAIVVLNVCVLGIVSAARVSAVAAPQTAQPAAEPPQMAENVFKNIQVLKGMPADEFMDTMGMFASSLLYDCIGCHVEEILTEGRDAFAKPTPRIQRARQMVVMVNALNKQYFAGQPRVTCYTCHRGSGFPDAIPDLALQYGDGPPENPNQMMIYPRPEPTADAVFREFIEEIGGAERVAKLTTYIATGTTNGFNTGGMDVPIEIFARAPDQLATVVRVYDGDAVKVTDGRNAWAAEGWRQLPLMTFTGSNLAGAKFDAMMMFPAGIQKVFARWQVGAVTIDDEEVTVLQGTNPGQLPVNLYFDDEGLLVRSVRWNSTPVGTVPTQADYSDYRDVGGLKMPFKIVVTWTNGQNTIQLKEIRPNAPIDPSRFARPAPFKPRQARSTLTVSEWS
jgi:hypothetical protein